MNYSSRKYIDVTCCKCGRVYSRRKDSIKGEVFCRGCQKFSKRVSQEYLQTELVTIVCMGCNLEFQILGRNVSKIKECRPCQTRKRKTTHGMSHHKLYFIYKGMRNRCHNRNVDSYIYYGARGIQVCDEWRYDFPSFAKWALANGYQPGLTIERVDVNGHYSPDNCTWITREAQRWNKRIRTGSLVGPKLSVEDVKQIKLKLQNGAAVGRLAKEFNVTRGTISKIKHGKQWADIHPDSMPNSSQQK